MRNKLFRKSSLPLYALELLLIYILLIRVYPTHIYPIEVPSPAGAAHCPRVH